MTTGLSVSGVTVKRNDLTVCRDVSFEVPAGEITVLLGTNGAGKSTLLDGLTGVLPVAAGQIMLDGERLERSPAHRRASRGLAYVTQERSVFTRLTVAQNLAVVDRSGAALDRACELFPRLADKRDTHAGLLSGGEQQMLVIARALATNPGVLLVDELSLGLAPRIVQSLMEVLQRLAGDGMGILLVEQYVDLALKVGETAHIMQRGEITLSRRCADLRADREFLASQYLRGTATVSQHA